MPNGRNAIGMSPDGTKFGGSVCWFKSDAILLLLRRSGEMCV